MAIFTVNVETILDILCHLFREVLGFGGFNSPKSIEEMDMVSQLQASIIVILFGIVELQDFKSIFQDSGGWFTCSIEFKDVP